MGLDQHHIVSPCLEIYEQVRPFPDVYILLAFNSTDPFVYIYIYIYIHSGEPRQR
jgi:hypothetical protein